MEKIVIDCCEMPLIQQGDSRVTFVHEVISSDGSTIVVQTTRSHCPLSVAMQVITFNQSVPNGLKDSYFIEPEKVDPVGHVE